MVTQNAGNIPTGVSGTLLQGAGVGTAPAFTTATYPATAGTSGKVLVSDGTNIVSSTPTFPNASATSGKFIRSDGTNWIASTPTLPTTGGTASTLLRSDGTNWVNTSAFKVSATDTMTNTAQPAVLAYKSSNTTNATGDATVITIVFDTVVFDQNSNYNNSTGTFTAPVTGRYLVSAQSYFQNLAAGHTAANIKIVASSRTFFGLVNSPGAVKNASNEANYPITSLVDMTAADTFTITATVSGSTKTVTLAGTASALTFLSIQLIC